MGQGEEREGEKGEKIWEGGEGKVEEGAERREDRSGEKR